MIYCSGFFINIGFTTTKRTTPFRYILLIHNVPIDRKNFSVNFCQIFLFAWRKCITDGTSHLAGFLIDPAILSICYIKQDGHKIKTNDRKGNVKGSRFQFVLPMHSLKQLLSLMICVVSLLFRKALIVIMIFDSCLIGDNWLLSRRVIIRVRIIIFLGKLITSCLLRSIL